MLTTFSQLVRDQWPKCPSRSEVEGMLKREKERASMSSICMDLNLSTFWSCGVTNGICHSTVSKVQWSQKKDQRACSLLSQLHGCSYPCCWCLHERILQIFNRSGLYPICQSEVGHAYWEHILSLFNTNFLCRSQVHFDRARKNASISKGGPMCICKMILWEGHWLLWTSGRRGSSWCMPAQHDGGL